MSNLFNLFVSLLTFPLPLHFITGDAFINNKVNKDCLTATVKRPLIISGIGGRKVASIRK